MERGSVGQTFLFALGDVRRQECPRHSGQHLSMAIDPVAICRYLAIHVGSIGSVGGSRTRTRTRTRTKIHPSALLSPRL